MKIKKYFLNCLFLFIPVWSMEHYSLNNSQKKFVVFLSGDQSIKLTQEEVNQFTVLENMLAFFKPSAADTQDSLAGAQNFNINDSECPFDIEKDNFNVLLHPSFPHNLDQLSLLKLQRLFKESNSIGFTHTATIAAALGLKFLAASSSHEAYHYLELLKKDFLSNDEQVSLGTATNLKILQDLALLNLLSQPCSQSMKAKMAEFKPPATFSGTSFSPDGKCMASGGYDKKVCVWNLATKTMIAKFKHSNWVNSVSFSRDGRYIVSGGLEAKVRVWDLATKTMRAEFSHDGHVNSVFFSPDGKYIASGGQDEKVRIWNLVTKKMIAEFKHSNWVNSVSFSPNGQYIASGGDDKKVYIWELATKTMVAEFSHDSWVRSVSFSYDGKYIASGGDDEKVRVWDLITKNMSAEFSHDSWVHSVSFSPDGKYIFSGGNDTTVRVWNLQTKKMIAEFEYDHSVKTISFSTNGLSLIVGTSKLVYKYDLVDLDLQSNYSQLDFKELLEMLYSKKKLIEPTQQL